jgi:hypothetical protein
MKKLITILLGILLISLTFLGGCIQTGQGSLVLQLTDAPDYDITEAIVNLSSIEVHFTIPGNNSSAGWYTVAEGPLTYDLIQLIDVKEIIAEEEMNAGIYTQIRLHVDSALVTINGTQYDLKIPSKTVKLVKAFFINESETTTLTLDFDVQKSIHKTGNDEYIMKPTITVIQE